MKLCDMHAHSSNSFDAKNSVDEMCQSAIDKGLYAIAITDHCESPMIKEGAGSRYGYFDELIPKSYNEAVTAKNKFAQSIKVLCGIELGEPVHDIDCTEKALNYGKFDFIIASVHNLRNMEDFYYLNFNNEDINKILNLYFDELAETAAFGHFDSLAHLTYPLRYIKRDTGKFPDLEEYQDKIDLIYEILIKNKKALEINVSGFYKGLDTSLPDENQIKRFKKLGGEYITIGSDAHCSGDVGRYIKKGIEIAGNAGFEYYVIYENRQPVLIDIR